MLANPSMVFGITPKASEIRTTTSVTEEPHGEARCSATLAEWPALIRADDSKSGLEESKLKAKIARKLR
jgi:hypothetical protein